MRNFSRDISVEIRMTFDIMIETMSMTLKLSTKNLLEKSIAKSLNHFAQMHQLSADMSKIPLLITLPTNLQHSVPTARFNKLEGSAFRLLRSFRFFQENFA